MDHDSQQACGCTTNLTIRLISLRLLGCVFIGIFAGYLMLGTPVIGGYVMHWRTCYWITWYCLAVLCSVSTGILVEMLCLDTGLKQSIIHCSLVVLGSYIATIFALLIVTFLSAPLMDSLVEE